MVGGLRRSDSSTLMKQTKASAIKKGETSCLRMFKSASMGNRSTAQCRFLSSSTSELEFSRPVTIRFKDPLHQNRATRLRTATPTGHSYSAAGDRHQSRPQKAGVCGADLYRKYIPGWDRHNRYHRIGERKTLMDANRAVPAGTRTADNRRY